MGIVSVILTLVSIIARYTAYKFGSLNDTCIQAVGCNQVILCSKAENTSVQGARTSYVSSILARVNLNAIIGFTDYATYTAYIGRRA